VKNIIHYTSENCEYNTCYYELPYIEETNYVIWKAIVKYEDNKYKLNNFIQYDTSDDKYLEEIEKFILFFEAG
jgi:hypothetical protein